MIELLARECDCIDLFIRDKYGTKNIIVSDYLLMSVLPYLGIFSTVVETGRFTAVAEALQISKPVVSKKITQLE